jgi:hypothetical protein
MRTEGGREGGRESGPHGKSVEVFRDFHNLSKEMLRWYLKKYCRCSCHTLAHFIICDLVIKVRACSSIVGWGTVLQVERLQVQVPMTELDFSINLILPATPWPCDQLSLQQKWVPGIFLWVKGSWHISLWASTACYRNSLILPLFIKVCNYLAKFEVHYQFLPGETKESY